MAGINRLVKTEEQEIAILDNRAFNDAGFLLQQIKSSFLVSDAILYSRLKLFPGKALFVHHLFIAHFFAPLGKFVGSDAQLFKIVKLVSYLIDLKPIERFFYRITVGDAINFHAAKVSISGIFITTAATFGIIIINTALVLLDIAVQFTKTIV